MANAKAEGTGNKTVSNWVDGLKAEFRKIIWPDQKSLVKQTGAVVAVSIALGIIITILDFIFQHGVDVLVNISF
jgi:preprotein translocase subunit SecE